MIISLDGKWQLRSTFLKNKLEVNVPGSIYNDLITNGLIEDPYYRDNEKRSLDCLKHNYIYERSFFLHSLSDEVLLCFDGIDTISEVYVNDALVLNTFNMHRRYEVNISKYLITGENKLAVKILPAIDYMNSEAQKCNYNYMQMYYAIKNYIYIRKAHCMFGWDWGPQLPDGGIFRSCYLKVLNHSLVKDVETIINLDLENSIATINVNINSNKVGNEKIEFQLYDEETLVYTCEQDLEDKNQIQFSIHNPKLWMPVGYGKSHLYDVIVNVKKGNEVITSKKQKLGIRKMEVIRQKDQFGESFTVRVNGVNVFLKGSNYIIEDNILPRRNKERTRILLEDAVMCNHNTIRVWGGAFFPEDYFYELCDELGLLVWQDLMFACSYYDVDNKDFLKEIKLEIIDNLTRIRNHPSLILICGNNENEKAIDWEGNVDVEKTMEGYIFQYEHYIKEIVNEVTPYLFYWPSSPSSGGGFDKPDDENRGDMHYWGVWHEDEPIVDYRKHYPRMLSEYGLQSFPSMKTIKSFALEEDLNIFSYVMECHQKNKTANDKIVKYTSQMFKFPKNLTEQVYLSQLIQAEGVRYCAEHLRRNYGRCMGSIYWQLNDCWPVASWSSIDYFGRYKALQYASKKFYAPVLISLEEDRENCSFRVNVQNDTLEQFNGNVEIYVLNLEGGLKEKIIFPCSLEKQSSTYLKDFACDYDFSERQNTFVYARLVNANNLLISENDCIFVPDKYLNLIKPNIEYKLTRQDDIYTIELKTDKVAKFVEIDFENYDFKLSDNFFNLTPQFPKRVTFKCTDSNLENKLVIKIKSLIDSY